MKIIVATLIFVSIPLVPVAQTVAACAPRDQAMASLKQRYNEDVKAIGVTQGGASVVEILTGPEGSWTIMETFPDGTSCTRSSGESWTDVIQLAGPLA